MADDLAVRVRRHLIGIYGEQPSESLTGRFLELLATFCSRRPPPANTPVLYDETDVVLIAYGDQVSEPDRSPLATLRGFLDRHMADAVPGLHLLPHYPATSDDGFAVADFSAVDPAFGDWGDVEALAQERRLMLDAVLNHTSASHAWFVGWLADVPRFRDFYIAVDPATDLTGVVRPRTTPLLTRFDSASGPRWVWTTFSADQVDLNYANPEVLLAVTAELLRYVCHGARMLRLDAVAFLWKEPGTSCMHLPQTHEIIRLWRTVLDAFAPGTLVVTETNVPHRENLTYFGTGDDEAHLVYQFALPPLTLDAFRRGTARRLADWAARLATPSSQTSFLNFLASHDGIGVRPVEGILLDTEVDDLCAAVRANGGQVSYRTRPDGTQSPYELNAVFLDALAHPGDDRARLLDRFLAAHSILLSLAGIPLLYFHSLVGSRNWTEGAERHGRARVINRQRFALDEIEAELADPTSLRRQVLDRMLARTSARVREPAFHPNGGQTVVDGGDAFLTVLRTPVDSRYGGVLCVHDVSGQPGRFRARLSEPLREAETLVDLVEGSEHVVAADGTLEVDVPGYGVRWLKAR